MVQANCAGPGGTTKTLSFYGKTLKEAEEKLAEHKAQEALCSYSPQDPPLKDWAMEWFSTKAGTSYKNRADYSSIINRYILPALGEVKISDIKMHHVQGLVSAQLSEGRNRTAQRIRSTMKQILDYAVKNELRTTNPAALVDRPRRIKPNRTPLDDLQIKKVLDAQLAPKQKAFVFTLLQTGLRRGEALALTVSDISLEKRSISVSKSLVFKSNVAEIKNCPKTDAGIREIPIPDILFSVLEQYLDSLENEIVFPSSKGKYMSEQAFKRFWEKVQNEMPLPKITPHIFRHTYSTTLYYAGVDIKTAQYLMGHASSAFMLDLYTHLDLKRKGQEQSKINAYFSSIR
jgi:integrase